MNYLLWLVVTIWFPALVLWVMVKKPFLPKLKIAYRLAILVAVTNLVVEYFILKYPMLMGHGNFLGIRIGIFPIEDILFFLTSPILVFALLEHVDTYFSRS